MAKRDYGYTKEEAEKEIDRQTNKYKEGFCPVINGKCKAPNCLSFRKGSIKEHDNKYYIEYSPICRHPAIIGGIDTRNC